MRSLPMDIGMTYFLKQDLQLIPELTDLARLDSQLAPGIHPPQFFQGTGIAGVCHHSWFCFNELRFLQLLQTESSPHSEEIGV